MLAVGRSRLAASSGLSLPKLSAIVARAIARSGPLSSGAANAITSQATFAPFVKANLPLLTTLVLREYATAAKKTATKKTATKKTSAKKSTKPAARRRTVAKKSGTRRTATKKKTAAKKKKAAPKKKKVVKKKKVAVKKPGIRVQYDKAMDAPPRRVSPYNLFFVEASKGIAAGVKASDRAKETAVQWHALSETDKQAWKDRAAEESIKRKAAYAQWLAKQNPVDIAAANNARNRIRAHRLQKGIKGSTSIARIRDDRLVKRSLTPWIFFVKEKIQTPEIVALDRREKLKRMSELWKATTDANKKKYADLAAKDAIRYKNEKAEFEKKYQN
ncbi:hypothetical protein TWF730_001034 [Orbilia blumenaviensis]|uniref:HMG box domain-containing protein n=1 Tax=Orbilia blumenaviensis TaxID=1796055 RepID=A0AAV9VR23_9PEZI